MKYLSILLSLLLCNLCAEAQKYYQVKHGLGSAVYGTRTIIFDTSGNISLNNVQPTNSCDSAGPHAFFGHADTSKNSLIYKFSKPVKYLRAQFIVVHDDERTTFSINGIVYNFAPSNLYTVQNCFNFRPGAITNGILKGDSISNIGVNIIEVSGIDSVKIQHNGKSGGCLVGLAFGVDTTIYVSKVTDSVLCAGDSINVDYTLDYYKVQGNYFIAQLSDKTGSFSNPTVIGSKQSTITGVINCKIPNTISNGSNYKIRVIATNPADTSVSSPITLDIANIDSSAVTTSSNSPVCEGNTINLTSSTNISSTTFQWTGPNSFNASLANTSIGGASPIHSGNYYITMKFYGCEVKDTLPVTIKPVPAKPITNNNSPFCAGPTINLTATTSTSGVTYNWTGPNSFTSATQNPSLSNSTVAMSGDYIVAADLNGCKITDTTTVIIKPLPTPVTLSNNSALCAGDTLKLNSTATTTGATYNWAGPNSFTASTQNAAIPNSLANMTGWYKLTVDLNACQYKDSTYATVHPIPTTPVVGFNTPLCVGETLNLTTSTVSGATYSWTGANGFTTNTQNPARNNITTGDAGVYNVTATVNGCTSPAGSANIAINLSPFVVIFVTPSDSVCQGDPVVFTALPNNAGGAPQYRWLVNAQQVGTGTVFNASALSNGDVVRCDMTEYTKCSSPYTDQSNDIEMKVLPWLAPSVTISANPNRTLEVDEYVTFTATPTNGGPAPLYQWKRNGQNIQGATGSVWSANTLNDNDKITTELISSYKCPQPTTAVSNSITVRVATAIANTNAIKGLTLYPNPNNGKFVLKGNISNNEKMQAEVINAVGQVVYKDVIIPVSGSINKEIDMPVMADGIYLLRINGMNGNIAQVKFSIY